MSYFEDKIKDANQRFLGADGWESADDWEGADDMEYADDDEGFDGQDMLQAAGNNTNESQPYIINVTNTTTNTIANVEILDANNRQYSPAVAGLSYLYGLPGITYQGLLAAISAGEVFNVGLTRVIATHSSSTSLAEAQVNESITVTTKSINGNQVVKPLTPLLDSYQQIKNQVDLRAEYMVTGLVSLVISQLFAGVTVKVILYPKTKVNQFRAIKGQKAVSGYSDPNINPFKKALTGGRKR